MLMMTYEAVAREQPRLVIQEDGTLTLKTNNLQDVNVPPGYILSISTDPVNGLIVVTVAGELALSEAAYQELNKPGITGPTNP